jgi:hypothetical protein
VLHLAAHGIMSTKFPARSALVLRPAGVEDGLLQAREILDLRLNAVLVTLSACRHEHRCRSGTGRFASLVRPFVAAGARAVVANLWAADDTFSAGLMREFYRELAGGVDIGESSEHVGTPVQHVVASLGIAIAVSKRSPLGSVRWRSAASSGALTSEHSRSGLGLRR